MNKTELEIEIRTTIGLKSHKLIHLNHVLDFFMKKISKKILDYNEIIQRWNMTETRFDKQSQELYNYLSQQLEKEKKCQLQKG